MICFYSLGLHFCMFKMHVRLLEFPFWGYALFLVFLGFLGKNLRTHNLACIHRLDYEYAGLFLCTSHCPKTLIFCFLLFWFCFHMFVCLTSFPMLLCFQCMFHMFNCLVCYHMLELGFILCFVKLWFITNLCRL